MRCERYRTNDVTKYSIKKPNVYFQNVVLSKKRQNNYVFYVQFKTIKNSFCVKPENHIDLDHFDYSGETGSGLFS